MPSAECRVRENGTGSKRYVVMRACLEVISYRCAKGSELMPGVWCRFASGYEAGVAGAQPLRGGLGVSPRSYYLEWGRSSAAVMRSKRGTVTPDTALCKV